MAITNRWLPVGLQRPTVARLLPNPQLARRGTPKRCLGVQGTSRFCPTRRMVATEVAADHPEGMHLRLRSTTTAYEMADSPTCRSA
jgi:hypothetical protein